MNSVPWIPIRKMLIQGRLTNGKEVIKLAATTAERGLKHGAQCAQLKDTSSESRKKLACDIAGLVK